MPERPPPDRSDPSVASRAASPGDSAVVLAVALTAALGVGLVLYACFVLFQWFGEQPTQPLNAGLIVAFSAGWGVALLACARGLLRRRRWARSPVLTSALVLVAVGWLLASGHGPEVVAGWLVLVLSAGTVVALLRPALARALT